MPGAIIKPDVWNVTPGAVDPQWLWAWDGLVFAVAPGGGWRNDLVNGGIGTVLNANWQGVSKDGKALASLNSTTGGAWWPWNARLATITTDYTVIVRAKPTTLVAYSTLLSIPYRSGASWTDPYTVFGLLRNDTNSSAIFTHSINTTTAEDAVSGSGFIQSTDPMTMYGATRKGTAVTFWRNGAQHSTATYSSNNAALWTNQQPVHLLQRGKDAQDESMVGVSSLAMIYNRALSRNEMKALYVDPFGFMTPAQQPRLYWLGAAPAAAKAPLPPRSNPNYVWRRR